MKTASILKACQKANLEVSTLDNFKFNVKGNGEYYGWFYNQDGRAVGVQCCHSSEQNDGSIDYFPSFGPGSIKNFIGYLIREKQ